MVDFSSNAKGAPKKEASTRKSVDESVSMDTEDFVKGRFGSVPPSFGGCRLDFFSLAADSNNTSSMDSMQNTNSSSILPLQILQKGYLPTSFDSTEEEWIEVKDYLWLLGQVYTPRDRPESPRPDREKEMFHIHRVAICMNNMQKLFLNVFGQVDTIINESESQPQKKEEENVSDDPKSVRLPIIFKKQETAKVLIDESENESSLLKRESANDEVLRSLAQLSLDVPPNLNLSDFQRLIIFSRQIEKFTDEILYFCFFSNGLEATLADISARIIKNEKIKSLVFGTQNIATIKKYIFSYCNKNLEILNSETTKYLCKLVDLSSCTFTALVANSDNWVIKELLSKLSISPRTAVATVETASSLPSLYAMNSFGNDAIF